MVNANNTHSLDRGLTNQISCGRISKFYFLSISLKSVLWFMRYFANRQTYFDLIEQLLAKF